MSKRNSNSFWLDVLAEIWYMYLSILYQPYQLGTLGRWKHWKFIARDIIVITTAISVRLDRDILANALMLYMSLQGYSRSWSAVASS